MIRTFAALAVLTFAAAAPLGAAADRDNKLPAEVLTALEKADEIELSSLDPERDRDEKEKDAFHGWKVLGKTTVKDSKTREKLVAALKEGVAASGDSPAKCFEPRHGVRVSYKGKTVDLVICFECYRIMAYVDGKGREGAVTTRTPQAAFDKVLSEAKVPLPAKPK